MRGEKAPRASSAWLAAIGLVVVLPILYVLSLGPLVYACHDGSARVGMGPASVRCSTLEPVLVVIYAPLIALHETRVGRALDWYVDLWGG